MTKQNIAIVACLLIITFTLTIKSKARINQKAPDFNLQDETGTYRTLQEFAGKKVVLYFYPKDESPYCTKEACTFRDYADVYKENNITVIGISYDSVASHKRFKEKYNLPFILLSDCKHKAAKSYGAHGIFGWFVPQRKTFLINEAGIIIYIFKNIHITSQADEILQKFKTEK